MADAIEPPDEPEEDAGAGEIVSPEGLNPWEKRASETHKAYAAFCVYRDMGPKRGLREVARRLGHADASVTARWSSRNDWVERVEAYDLELDRRYRDAREAEVVELARRQASQGARLQLLAMERIRGNPERDVEPLSPAELGPGDVARFMELGVRIERLALGLPTDLFRGAYSITLPEFQDAMRKVLDVAIQFIPEARRGAFMTAIEGLGS